MEETEVLGMTKRQHDCLEFIRGYIASNGYSPSYDEIGRNLGMVKSSVHRLINGLKARGRLRNNLHYARTLQIVELSS